MKSNKVKVFALVIFIASVSTILGIVACKAQPKPALPIEPSLTQASSAIPPSPTFPPPSAAVLENLFGNSACSWPCWQGITPGITTSSDALQKLQDSPLIPTKYAIQSRGSKTGLGTAKWLWYSDDKRLKKYGYDKRLEEYGYMDWNDGIVNIIKLTASPNIISIGEMINRFGDPEKIAVVDCSDSPDSPQFLCGTLLYTEKGFAIDIIWSLDGVWTYESENIQIMPSNPIESVTLFKSSTIEVWLSSKDSNGFGAYRENLRDWKGYGNLPDLYVQ